MDNKKKQNGNKFSPPRAQKTTLAPFSTKMKFKRILIVSRAKWRSCGAGGTEGFNDPSADPLRSSGDDRNLAQIPEGHVGSHEEKGVFLNLQQVF